MALSNTPSRIRSVINPPKVEAVQLSVVITPHRMTTGVSKHDCMASDRPTVQPQILGRRKPLHQIARRQLKREVRDIESQREIGELIRLHVGVLEEAHDRGVVDWQSAEN